MGMSQIFIKKKGIGTKVNPIVCYNCREKGHTHFRYPEPLIKCSHINKVGHKPEACRMKQDARSTKTYTVAKTMRISSSFIFDKFIKTINANVMTLEAFVDLGSEVTLISLKGFDNNIVQSMGSAKLLLTIDDVAATD